MLCLYRSYCMFCDGCRSRNTYDKSILHVAPNTGYITNSCWRPTSSSLAFEHMGSTASADAGRQKLVGRYSCDAHGGKAFKVTKASDRITDPRFDAVRSVFERSLNSAGVACVAAAPRTTTCCGHCSERSVVAQREALLADFCPQVNNELLQAHGFQCSAGTGRRAHRGEEPEWPLAAPPRGGCARHRMRR